MRLKISVQQQYFSEAEFWRNSCSYRGKGCCNPKTEEYKKECEAIWAEWHKKGSKGKLPVMPPETVECEKCQYADLSLGRFQGHNSLNVISRHYDGTLPVPVEGRKKVWIDNCSNEQLDGLIERFDKDLEAFAISGSPKISDF
ncbi:MAG: hypothetical protein K2N18_00735, partial [Clostridia bacterium]|nr:hypothetical protein [Clostridia bacterium]